MFIVDLQGTPDPSHFTQEKAEWRIDQPKATQLGIDNSRIWTQPGLTLLPPTLTSPPLPRAPPAPPSLKLYLASFTSFWQIRDSPAPATPSLVALPSKLPHCWCENILWRAVKTQPLPRYKGACWIQPTSLAQSSGCYSLFWGSLSNPSFTLNPSLHSPRSRDKS